VYPFNTNNLQGVPSNIFYLAKAMGLTILTAESGNLTDGSSIEFDIEPLIVAPQYVFGVLLCTNPDTFAQPGDEIPFDAILDGVDSPTQFPFSFFYNLAGEKILVSYGGQPAVNCNFAGNTSFFGDFGNFKFKIYYIPGS
jgi:hypothetical protein